MKKALTIFFLALALFEPLPCKHPVSREKNTLNIKAEINIYFYGITEK